MFDKVNLKSTKGVFFKLTSHSSIGIYLGLKYACLNLVLHFTFHSSGCLIVEKNFETLDLHRLLRGHSVIHVPNCITEHSVADAIYA